MIFLIFSILLIICIILFLIYYIFNIFNPNISLLFKNEKIKTYLYDRYWIYKNKSNIKNKNIFFVLGSNTNEYLKELTTKSDYSLQNNFFNNQKNAFEIINIESVSYIFINDILIKNKINDNNQENINILTKEINFRLLYNINKILKIRNYISIDGVIIFPSNNAFSLKHVLKNELHKEAQTYSNVFKHICNKLKSKTPLFFIEKSDFANTQFFKNHNDYQDKLNTHFGFNYSTSENSEELEQEIKTSIDNYVSSLEIETQYYLQNSEAKDQANIIQFFYKLKSGIISFSKNYINLFYKEFNLKYKYLTNRHYILNSSAFNPDNENPSNFLSMFKYISNNLINGSEISNEYKKNKITKRILFIVFTIFNFLFVTYTLYNSMIFLQLKRSVFVESFSELNNFIKNYNSNSIQSENNNYIQNNMCKLINNSNKLSSTSFYTPLLYPSWISNLDKKTTQKYNIKLSNFISIILLKNFNDKTENYFLNYKPSEIKSTNPKEILQLIIKFANESKLINEIYFLLNSNEKNTNIAALNKMAYFLYGINCKDIKYENEIFASLNIDNNISKSLNIKYSDFKTESNNALNNLIQFYFSNFSKNNEITLAAKKIESDLLSLNDIVSSDSKNEDINYSKTLSYNIKNLQKILANNSTILKNYNNLFGTDFNNLIINLNSNELFSKEIINSTQLLAKQQFEDFKSSITNLYPLGTAFPIIINNAEILTINPILNQIATALDKMNNIFNIDNNNSSEKNLEEENSFSSDLKSIALTLPLTSSWDIDKLQNYAQKGIEFSKAASSVSQALVPYDLALFLNKISRSLSYKFWNKNIPASLKEANHSFQPFDFNNNSDPQNQNIQISSPILKSISDQLALFKLSEINEYLLSIIHQQISRQAHKYFNLLNSSLYFKPVYSDFSWWSGENSPAFEAFGVNSDDELKTYIANQKTALEQFYTNNISALIQSYTLVFKDSNTTKKDNHLESLLSLQDALSATPKINSFANFSNFITSSMSPLRTDSCQKFINQTPMFIKNTDFFSMRLSEIYTSLVKRCQNLMVKRAYSNYNNFAHQYNSILSGKFPFNTNSKNSESASTEELNIILRSFDELQKQDISTLVKYSALYNERLDVQEFIKNINDINTLFGFSNSKDNPQTISKLNVEINFRSNQDKEVLANQILNWTLQSGNQTIGSEFGNDTHGQFIWTYSEPIQFSVTLANSSKYILNKSSNDKNMLITNNTVFFNIRNRWSLFKFINDYADCNINNKICLKNNLKFELPINSDKMVRFYITLSLKNTKGQRINMPIFPELAPYLEVKR